MSGYREINFSLFLKWLVRGQVDMLVESSEGGERGEESRGLCIGPRPWWICEERKQWLFESTVGGGCFVVVIIVGFCAEQMMRT